MPFLVLGNKIDAPGAVSEEELRGRLGLYQTSGKGKASQGSSVRPIEVFMCSVVLRQGYAEGMALKKRVIRVLVGVSVYLNTCLVDGFY